MPSKLKKAIGAVKDQTSISLAKVVNTNSSNLDVAVLKATTRDQVPIDERYVEEILQTISSNKLNAAICAHAIAKRIGKTKNWVVALKSLMLVLRIFQDGDPFFPQEVLHARNRGAKILNLSTSKDYSNSSPYDYTAFVRSFALYLDERLDCFVTGKLQRRFTYKEKQSSHPRSRRVNQQPIRDMKPPMLLDRISYWQRLLDRAIATKPTGAAKTNRLVLVSLYAVVRESFDLYRDISDGLGLLLDGFFHLQYQSCVNAFQYCVKATKQFEELSSFYDFCKSLGIGRTSEYPSVQKISEELMETLQEFLKDQASFPSPGKSPSSNSPQLLLLPVPPAKDPSETTKKESQAGLRCTSLEDLMSQTESAGTLSPSFSTGQFPEVSAQRCHEQEDMYNVTETGSNHSLPIDQGTNVTIDFVSFDDWPTVDKIQEQQDSGISDSTNGEKGCWGIDLLEAPQQPVQASKNLPNDHSFFDNWVQEDNKQEQASQNGENGLSLFNNWLQEDHRKEQASQIGGNGHSYINDWLQENQQLEQASRNVANGHSFFDDWLREDKKEPEEQQQNSASNWSNGDKECWELVPVEAATQIAQASQRLGNGIEPSMANYSFDQRPTVPPHQFNPQIVANGHSCFDDWLQEDKKEPEEQQQNSASNWSNAGKEGWELVPVEAATQPAQASQRLTNEIESSTANYLFDQRPIVPPRQYNPFLEDETDISASIATTTNENAAFPDKFSLAPTFQAAPTFFAQSPSETDISLTATSTNDNAAFPDNLSMAPTFRATPTFFAQSSNEMAIPTFQATPTSNPQNPNGTTAAFQDDEYDPFAPWPTMKANNDVSSDGSVDQQNVLLQQELWLQNQNKIMARHMV